MCKALYSPYFEKNAHACHASGGAPFALEDKPCEPGGRWLPVKRPPKGMHGLVLGGSRDVSVHGQVGQARLDCGCGGEEVCARAPAVEPDEADDPFHRGEVPVGSLLQTRRADGCVE